MSFKVKPPVEDPETKARRELAEKRAETGRLEEAGTKAAQDTRQIVRQFGRLGGPSSAAQSLVPPNLSGLFQTSGISSAFSGGRNPLNTSLALN